MKKYQEWLLRSFIICFGTGIAMTCLFWLPDIAERSAQVYPHVAFLKSPVYWWMIITTIPFYLALYQTNALLNLIRQKEAFTSRSTKLLGSIARCGFIIAVSYALLGAILVIFQVFHVGVALAMGFLILTSLTISFFAKLLKTLLEEALRIKNENDLTI